MIYLDNTTEAQSVMIPRNEDFAGSATFTLFSTMEREAVEALSVNVVRTPRYYSLALALTGVKAVGEYEYTLSANGRRIACGIARIGDYRNAGDREINPDFNFRQNNGQD